jgi:hypothetical protein
MLEKSMESPCATDRHPKVGRTPLENQAGRRHALCPGEAWRRELWRSEAWPGGHSDILKMSV